MPLHDWSRTPDGLYHHFHQSWTIRLSDALNRGLLPQGTSALVEQRALHREPDVLAIEAMGPTFDGDGSSWDATHPDEGGVATIAQPQTQIVTRSERAAYADLANRIVVRHHLGRIVAVIEIVSPGNKDSRARFRGFVDKTIEFLMAGVHVLVVDPFPPSPHAPSGTHHAIWSELSNDDVELPEDKDRLFVSYECGDDWAAWIEPIAVGDEVPDMPLFLEPSLHVSVPLSETYAATWEACPAAMRRAVEHPH